jgi:hypothetical protein
VKANSNALKGRNEPAQVRSQTASAPRQRAHISRISQFAQPCQEIRSGSSKERVLVQQLQNEGGDDVIVDQHPVAKSPVADQSRGHVVWSDAKCGSGGSHPSLEISQAYAR